jgi:hypothetical protein
VIPEAHGSHHLGLVFTEFDTQPLTMSYGTQKNKTCVYCVYICYILVVFSKLVSSVFLGGIPWAFEIRSILEMQWGHGRGSSWGQVGGYSNGSIRLPGSKYVQNKPWPFWPGK